MTIATSITESYFERSKPLFESVNKNFQGRKICFCMGFETKINGWEVVRVDERVIKWQPKNRNDYYSLQHGEFTEHIEFDPDEIILFCDSDMVLQRKFDLKFNKDEVYVTSNSYPSITVNKAIMNIKGDAAALRYLGKEVEFSASWLCMSASNWKSVYQNTISCQKFLDYFEHHAAWQVLINIVLEEMMWAKGGLTWLPDFAQNAIWYAGTGTRRNNGKLYIGNKVVYFNHTKFNKEWQ